MNRLTSSQMATVRAEMRRQGLRGLQGVADIQTRISAAQHRYGYNPYYGPLGRTVLGVVGMLCVIGATWRKRIRRAVCGTDNLDRTSTLT